MIGECLPLTYCPERRGLSVKHKGSLMGLVSVLNQVVREEA